MKIKDVAATVGGVVALARRLGLSRGAVSAWSRVPERHLLAVERVTGISRARLRPELFRARRAICPICGAPTRGASHG